MSTATNLADQVLEFSRAYFAEPEARQRESWRPRVGSLEKHLLDQSLPEGAPADSGISYAQWDGWLSRGIPELASPLAG